jgi:diguanylate cyclase
MTIHHVFDTLNIGVVILDKEMRVHYWNNWMAVHSGRSKESIIGANLVDIFPNLNEPNFLRSFKSVLKFGNFYYFSQKLHRYLFPMKTFSSFESEYEFMQQSCSMCPIRDDNNAITHICITVQDVTELADYEKRLIEMNLKDGLTGAFNRRFLTQRLEEEFERHRRYARSLSLLMIDIDHFKHVNDTYGHQIGDLILKSVASEILIIMRKVDLLIRYGGEEFCCILPETNLDSAMVMAERIRRTIEKKVHEYDQQKIQITVSVGVHEFKGNLDSADTLLKKADEALYLAKDAGRNKVIAVQ